MIQSLQPHSNLKHIIREYYLMNRKLKEGALEIPIVDDCCHDILFLKEGKTKFKYGPNEVMLPIDAKIFTVLGLEPPYKLNIENSITLFTIKIQPWMNRLFFGKLKPLGIVNLQNYNSNLTEIHQQLEQVAELHQLVESANNLFLAIDIEFTSKIDLIKNVCEFIILKKGLVKVQDIADHFNKSRQYINKVFSQEVMCSLKTFITAVRIMALVKHKAKTEDLPLTQLTYDFGYFDQAHFINDFKKVCGVTPRFYFENLPEFILRHA